MHMVCRHISFVTIINLKAEESLYVVSILVYGQLHIFLYFQWFSEAVP